MVNEEPSIKVSYDTNKETQPMPKVGNCSDYFKYESDANSYYYLSEGQATLSVDNYLVFGIYITDETYSRLNHTSPMIMQTFDSEYPYQNKHPKLKSSIDVGNIYALTESNGTNVFFFRYYRLRREELDHSFLTQLGWKPKYEIYNYIESEMQTIEYSLPGPFNDVYDDDVFYNFYAKVVIKLKTNIIEVEREQRARTILEVLANIAALYGLAF
ncbi:4835_t:CDS:2, partial [Diversispora eburnea]